MIMELVGGLLMLGLIGLFGMISSVCGIIILVSAFQDEVLEGILCLFIPLYILYYGGWKFDHDKRALILVGWLGPIFVYCVIALIGAVISTPPVI
jgi:hypothetical protein